jgi:alanine-synthesizing transaminase
MYSHRLQWDHPANILSQRISRRRAPFLDLTVSNPTQAGFSWPDGLLTPLGGQRGLRYEPDPRGIRSARLAVGEVLGFDHDQILLTASTSEAYSFLFQLLADPGDEILSPQPSYPLFEFLAGLSSVRIVPYPLFYDGGWAIDLAALEAAVTRRSRAIVLVNPNNPTGGYLKRPELEALERMCRTHDMALISDEVFTDFRLVPEGGEGSVSMVAKAASVPAFSLGGLSKSCGLPQLKLGWIAGNCAEAMNRLELIADTFLSVGTPVQLALPRLLASRWAIQTQILARLKRNLGLLPEALHVEGGWYAIVRAPQVKSDEEWALELLDEQDVLVQPGYYYDFPSGTQLVLSLLTPEAQFEEGVLRMRGLFDRALG